MLNRIKAFIFAPKPDPDRIHTTFLTDRDIKVIKEALVHYCEKCDIGLKSRAGAASHRRAQHKA